MTEAVLFAIFGIIAVFAAVFMLISDNAVHSALFLIVTMGCVAILFLLLNAPFLAMIQITVYTGAIMVLFLFVIMLLGAERLHDADATPGARRFGWFSKAALSLVIALLLVVGIVLARVNLNLQTDVAPPPQVRVLNAAPDAGVVDVYANDKLVASGLPFQETSTYVSLPAGDYAIKVQPANGSPLTTNVSLQKGTQQTLVDYGSGVLSLGVVPDDNTPVTQGNGARLTVFNADTNSTTVRLVALSSNLQTTYGLTLVDGLKPGQASDPIYAPEGSFNWAIVDVADPQTALYSLDNYSVKRETSGVLVYTQERVFNGTPSGFLRPLAISEVGDAEPSFGGPRAIGLELFTNYVLVFQLLGVLLLASMVGAIVLTHREQRNATRKTIGRRIVSRPLVNVIASQVGHDVTSSGESLPELQEPDGAPVGK